MTTQCPVCGSRVVEIDADGYLVRHYGRSGYACINSGSAGPSDRFSDPVYAKCERSVARIQRAIRKGAAND